MDILIHRTKSMLEEVDICFRQLNNCVPQEAHLIENDIKSRLDEIQGNCNRLDVMVNKEVQSRRSAARLRVEQFKYDCNHLNASLHNLTQRRLAQEAAKREREELMSSTFSRNEDTSIMIDQSLCQNRSLNNAHRGMDELLGSGNSVLENLREQRVTLKGAHKVILDIANKLGLSNTVMRLIEKRSHCDKYILVIGMIVSLLIMFLIVKYFTNIF